MRGDLAGVQNARLQLEVSGESGCNRDVPLIVLPSFRRKPPDERLATDSETGKTPSRPEESGIRENKSKQQSLGAEKCPETATRSTRPQAEGLEFGQISLFPTCSGAPGAALVLLLAGFSHSSDASCCSWSLL